MYCKGMYEETRHDVLYSMKIKVRMVERKLKRLQMLLTIQNPIVRKTIIL